jgi:hypothetical protein
MKKTGEIECSTWNNHPWLINISRYKKRSYIEIWMVTPGIVIILMVVAQTDHIIASTGADY